MKARAISLAWFLGVLMIPIIWLMSLHLTINVTPSMPIGFYRFYPIDRPLARGDIVRICAPSEVARLMAGEGRGMRGTCPYQTAPLLKFVAALPGDVVDVSDEAVIVNGTALPGSAVPALHKGGPPRISRGRYVLGPGRIWLWTPYYRSLDSRYFGAVRAADVQGFARPALTGGSWADWAGGMRSLASIPPHGKKK